MQLDRRTKYHQTDNYHIHAKYAEFEVSIDLSDGEILAGDLPRKQLRLVQAWIELHRDELMADWESCHQWREALQN